MLLIWNRVIEEKWKNEHREGKNGLAYVGFGETWVLWNYEEEMLSTVSTVCEREELGIGLKSDQEDGKEAE